MTDELSALPDAVPDCVLCTQATGIALWHDEAWRVIRVADADHPAFYRVISRHHVAEFSALLAPERARCMDLVCAIERVLIDQLRPTKINLAALGNMVPHLHWHVIARFEWDSHFPQAVWGARQREVSGGAQSRLRCRIEDLDALVVEALQTRD